jgi:outer membrane immunogenic protein
MRAFVAIGGLLAATSLAWGADIAPGPYPPPAPAPAVYAPAPPPVYDWTGFYIGANAGWSFVNVTDTATFTGGLLGGLSASGTGSANGAVAGAQIGYNYQVNAVVLGMEGDFDWSGVSETATAGIVSQTSKVPWLATIRARVGFAVDRVLFYGTAGAAFVDVSDNVTATGFGTLYNASQVDFGWTVGAGVEAAFAQNWTARVEYLYADTNLSLSGPVALIGGNLAFSGTLSDSIVRAGINFKYP